MPRVNAYIPSKYTDTWKDVPNKSKLIQWALDMYIKKQENKPSPPKKL